MLNTKQVRKIMRDGGAWNGFIYTNPAKSENGDIRHVKCYYNPGNARDLALLVKLKAKAGKSNVWITKGAGYRNSLPGIIVKCKLA